MKFTETSYFKNIEDLTTTTAIPGLNRRFRVIFEALENLNLDEYNILETGCIRSNENTIRNWIREGQFTIIADEFVKFYKGHVYSVNINPSHVAKAKSILSEKCTISLDDSISFLRNFKKIDDICLFYLDSMDLDYRNDPKPSELHHLKEFNTLLVKRTLPNFYVVVDDSNIEYNGNITGKGNLIKKYLESLNVNPILDDYQIMYFIDEDLFKIIKNDFLKKEFQ